MRFPFSRYLRHALNATPQLLPVAIVQPQDAVNVFLTAGDKRVDVSCSNVIAALRPLTIGIGVDQALPDGPVMSQHPTLDFVDRLTGSTLGSLHLNAVAQLTGHARWLRLFEVHREEQRCVSGWSRIRMQWMLHHARSRQKPGNFVMSPQAIAQFTVFYICPRPVVAVSVDDGTHQNIFPMDLIGPLSSERFTLALRGSSPSIPTMQRTRKIAISDIAGEHAQVAYALGEHHTREKIDLDNLAFGIDRSPKFGLPVPDIALRIREIEILDAPTVGSHVFFVGRIVTETRQRSGAQFSHVAGIYQSYQTRLRRPMLKAP